MIIARRALPEVGLGFSLAIALTMLTFRAGRLLTFDGYYYCELAKRFSVSWPDRFGYHWPVGYPLAGGLVARLGPPAYFSLVVISLVALVVLLLLTAQISLGNPRRVLIVAALGAAPIIAPQIGGVLSELPFAAAFLGLAWSFGHWPTRWAIWASALCVVGAFSFRYAGLIALAAMTTWGLIQARNLRRADRLGDVLAATIATVMICVGLLWLNVMKSGYASGAGRGASLGMSALPSELRDFGWSIPSALVAGGLRDRVGVDSVTGEACGAVLIVTFVTMAILAWLRPCTKFSRPLALTAVGYALGMAVLRCVGEFDALHNARTFLPALPATWLLFAERLQGRPTVFALAAIALIGAGTVAASRGISREIGGDVRPVLTALQAQIRPADTIAINDAAFAVAAYFPEPTRRVFLQYWNESVEEKFIVIAGEPRNRRGVGAVCPPEWVALCEKLVTAHRYRFLVKQPQILALERIDPAPAGSH